MIGNGDCCSTLGSSLMLRTATVTVSGSCDEMAGAEWFCLIWLHILKKLAVKMLVWNSAWSRPLSLHAWSKAHAAEMDLFILVLSICTPAAQGKLESTACDTSALAVAACCWPGIGGLPQGGVESGREQTAHKSRRCLWSGWQVMENISVITER